MRFTVIKTIIVTTKEMHKVEIAGYLDPLDYIAGRKPIALIVERDVKVDIFKEEATK